MKIKRITTRRIHGGRRIIAGSFAVIMIASAVIFMLRPAHVAADIAYISQTSNVAATAAGTLIVNAPSGIALGNVMIAHTLALPGTGNTVTTTGPTGWVKIGSAVTSNKYSMTEFYKIATASEPSTYTFSFSIASTAAIAIGAFSGVDTKAPVDVQGTQINNSTTSHTAPSVSTTYNTDMVLPLWGYESNTTAATFPAGVTSIWNTSTTSNGIAGAYKALTNSGATGTFVSTTAAGTNSLAHTIALKPTTASAGVQYVNATAPDTSCVNCSSVSEAAPTNWKTGDLLITSITWNTNTSTLTTLSGWTQIDSQQNSGAFAVANFYHFVISGDPSSYSWSFSAPTAKAMISTVDFQGVDSAQPIDISAQASSVSGTTHLSPTVTTNYAQDMLVDIWAWNTGTTATAISSGMFKFWDAQTGNASTNDSTAAGYELLGVAGATGTRSVNSGRNAIAMMHSIALKAFLPTPSLISPASGTPDTTLFPAFQLVNASLTSSPLKYKIQLCSTSNCSSIITTYDQTLSQTGWSGQDALTGTAYVGSTDPNASTNATYTIQSALTACTQYWWRGLSYDTAALQLSNPSNINSFTTSCVPAAPTLIDPPNGNSNVRINPEFHLATTDADTDYIRYKIQLCTTSNCSSVLYTWDQTASQVSWTGQDSQSFTAYTSDDVSATSSGQAFYTLSSSALTPNTQYWWRAYAIDPGGTNTFSAASSISSFTTNAAETKILTGKILNGTIL